MQHVGLATDYMGSTAHPPLNQSSSSMQTSFSASMQDFLSDIQEPLSRMASGGPQNVDALRTTLGAGPMSGLEPLGYSEAVSLFQTSSTAEPSRSGLQSLFPEGAEYQGNPDIPDFAVLSDTLSAWTNGPTSFG